MKDIFLYAAGGLGMVIAVVHGYLGETRVVAPAALESRSAKRILHAVMFLSAVYWFACGLVLTVTPAYIAEPTRPVVAFAAAAIFASGALANFWATRGRHFGWMLLSAAVALTLLGA